MHRYRLALLAAFLGLITLSAHAAPSLHHNFNVAPGGTLYVDADVGSIRVIPGSGSGVQVTVERSGSDSDLRDLHINFQQVGNDAHITARTDTKIHWFFSWIEVRYIVTVPSQYNTDLRTSGGSIEVGNLHGRVAARTSGGSIRMAHIDGPVDANTSGGSVHLDSARTAVLKTSGGRIQVGDVASHLEARTSGGSIEVHRAGDLIARTSGGSITTGEIAGTIDAHTSGGSIHATLARQPSAASQLSTSGGGITLSLASNIAVTIDAHASGGGVESDVPVEMVGRQSEGSLSGKIRGGGPRLELHSSGGSIHVRPL